MWNKKEISTVSRVKKFLKRRVNFLVNFLKYFLQVIEYISWLFLCDIEDRVTQKDIGVIAPYFLQVIFSKIINHMYLAIAINYSLALFS